MLNWPRWLCVNFGRIRYSMETRSCSCVYRSAAGMLIVTFSFVRRQSWHLGRLCLTPGVRLRDHQPIALRHLVQRRPRRRWVRTALRSLERTHWRLAWRPADDPAGRRGRLPPAARRFTQKDFRNRVVNHSARQVSRVGAFRYGELPLAPPALLGQRSMNTSRLATAFISSTAATSRLSFGDLRQP